MNLTYKIELKIELKLNLTYKIEFVTLSPSWKIELNIKDRPVTEATTIPQIWVVSLPVSMPGVPGVHHEPCCEEHGSLSGDYMYLVYLFNSVIFT